MRGELCGCAAVMTQAARVGGADRNGDSSGGRRHACRRRSEMDSSQSKLMMLDPMPMLSNHAIHATSLQDAPTVPTEV